jgi:hypothetical protein
MTRASWKQHAAVAALFAAPVVVFVNPALAQPRPPPLPIAAPAPATPSPNDVAKATAYFQKGAELLKAKKFTQALEQFKLSYGTVPSPNSHLYIARCLAGIGESRGAYIEFDKVLDEATARSINEPKYVPARDSARAERDELAPKLGLVTITVAHPAPGSVVYLGAYQVPADRWGRPFPIEPGSFEARVETPGRPVVRTPITLGPGQRFEVSLDVAPGTGPLVPPPPVIVTRSKINPLRIGGFVAAGVGVVGFGIFAGAGVASSATYSDLTLKCGTKGGCGGQNVSAEVSSGQTQQAIANAGLVVGIVGIAAGAALIVLSTRKPRDAAGQPTADLIVGPGWLGAKGTF